MNKHPFPSWLYARRWGALEIAVLYLIIGSAWILFSDRVATRVALNKEMLAMISIYKGWGYVLVTALLLYWLIRRHTDAVQASEKQLQRVMDALPALISYVDANQNYRFVNSAYEDWFNRPVEGKHIREVIGNSAYQTLSKHIDRVLTGETTSYESVVSLPGGERFISATCVPDIGISGEVRGFFALVQDVTEQKQAQEERRQWADAFDGCAHGIAISDPDTNRILVCNPAFAGMYKCRVEDIVGVAILGLYAPSDHELVRRSIEKADQIGHARFESRMVRGDGSIFPVEMDVVSVLGDDGELLHRVISAQDISERKFIDEKLKQSEAKYRTLIEHLPVITYISGSDQYIGVSYISPQIESLGFASDAWVADPELWLRQIHPDDRERVLAELQQFEAGAKSFKSDYRLLIPSGETRWVHDESIRVINQSGNTVFKQGFMLDITERKRAEEENESLARFPAENPNPVLRATQEGKIIYANAASEPLLQEWSKRVGDNFPVDWINMIGEIIHTGARKTLEIQCKDITYSMMIVRVPETNYVNLYGKDITESKQAEQYLRRFELLSEHSRDIILFMRRDDGRILEANAAAMKAYGYSRDELLALTIADLRAPETQALTADLMAQADAGGILFETIHRRKDGATFPVEVSSQGATLGGVRTLISVVRDITERKQAEESLRNSQAQLRGVFNSAMDAIISTDSDQRIVIFNPSAETMFRCSQSEATGQPLDRFIPERFREAHRKQVHNFGETGVTNRAMRGAAVVMGLRSNGEEFPCEASISQIVIAGKKLYTVILRDITARKQADLALQKARDELELKVQERTAALSEANSLLQALMDTMPDHIYFKDMQSRFIRNSRSQANLLGLNDPSEAVGKTDFDFFPHAAKAYAEEQEVMRSGKALVDFEEWVVWPDGRETWVSTTKVPLRNSDGETIGIFGISRDITERKRNEQSIRQLNNDLEKQTTQLQAANKELEAFSYSVSHDLRAPLRAIDGYTRILVEDYESTLDAEGKRICGVISKEARRMGQLIDDLLAFSRLGRKEMYTSNIDMRTLAVSVLNELLKQTDRERITIQIARLPSALADSSLMRQVWVNLLSNAIKFTSRKERAVIEVGSKTSKDELIYYVRDSGAGFDAEYANKLFGVFQRLHSESEFPGTGVGLAIVQRIILRHGGRVWAEGEVGKGATFYFALPRKEIHS